MIFTPVVDPKRGDKGNLPHRKTNLEIRQNVSFSVNTRDYKPKLPNKTQ